jgi:CRP-like cAMP-binding protein
VNLITIIGTSPEVVGLIPLLQANEDYSVCYFPHDTNLADLLAKLNPRLVVLDCSEWGAVQMATDLLKQHKIPWVAWLPAAQQAYTLELWQSGAWSVVIAEESKAILPQLVQNILNADNSPHAKRNNVLTEQQYRQGEAINVAPKEAVVIQIGVASFNVLHSDGTEILLGLFGVGQILLHHPDDSCHVCYTAHTDLTVTRCSWDKLLDDAKLLAYLHARLLHMEAWAAAQAHPHLEQRILGIFNLLAEQFGRPTPTNEILIDVRLTHSQLASAIGANRTTVTRLLSELRRRKLITVTGCGKLERFCLTNWNARGYEHFPSKENFLKS